MKVHLISLVNAEDTLYYLLNDEGLKELENLAMDYCMGIYQISKENVLARPTGVKELVEILNKNKWEIEEEFSAVLY